MIRQIAPLFFTLDISATVVYYEDKLGFECVGTRELGDTPRHSREFVVKDCDGRLLAFGANP